MKDESITDLQGNLVQFGAGYKKQYKGFELSGKGAINISGDYDANYLTRSSFLLV